jgi:hypothetical protein
LLRFPTLAAKQAQAITPEQDYRFFVLDSIVVAASSGLLHGTFEDSRYWERLIPELLPDWIHAACRDRLGIKPIGIPGGHSPFISRPRDLDEQMSAMAAPPRPRGSA